jgi:quercetin dioxygenase-like cupin family protein
MHAPREWLCAAFALLALLPAGSSPVEVANEPHHHLVLQNKYLHVYKVELPPGKQTLLHHHGENFVSVTLGEAQIENDAVGKPPASLKTGPGDVRMTSAPLTHLVKNLGSTPFLNITVEILPRSASAAASSISRASLRTTPGVSRTDKGETEAVRVFETIINNGVTVPEHVHSVPHLLVALNDIELQSNVAGQPPQRLRFAAGDVRWFDAGLNHSVTNVAGQPAHYVTLEFK